MAEDNNKNYQKIEVIARFFGKTTRRIQQLTQDGVLPTEQTPQGRRYDLLPTIKNYIQYLESRAERKMPQSMEEKQEKKLDAEIKYKQAKADKAVLELKEVKGIMHRSEDVEKLTNELVFAVRSMLLAMPGRCAMDLAGIQTAPEVSQYLRQQVAAMLDELATHEYNPDDYLELVRARDGSQAVEGDDDDEEV